jgi:hypothetical protein
MTEKLKQTIKEEVVKLSKETQEAIGAFGWVKITEEIGKKYLLTDSEINDFQAETLLVLVGIESAESYAQNIESNVGTTENEAKKILNEVFEKIFEPIANILEENIKKNLSTKTTTWQQSIDFILSGGDYSAFMTSAKAGAHPGPGNQDATKLVGGSNMIETKNRLIN